MALIDDIDIEILIVAGEAEGTLLCTADVEGFGPGHASWVDYSLSAPDLRTLYQRIAFSLWSEGFSSDDIIRKMEAF